MKLFSKKILSNIHILDFSRLLPGPLATHSLVEMGANVTKVESPLISDWLKSYGSYEKEDSFIYNLINKDKKIVSLDFTNDSKRVNSLIKTTDILVEQFRPGVMAKFKLDYKTARKINPQIIYISLTGYSKNSSRYHSAGHDINYLAESGLLGLNKDRDERPIIPQFQLADVAGGSYPLIMACLGALYYREKTGNGQYISLSIKENLSPLLALPYGLTQTNRMTSDPSILQGGYVNYNIYQTLDGRWMALGALELKFWNHFCDKVHYTTWKRDQLKQLSIDVFPELEVHDLFRSRSFKSWCELAKDKDCCLSPILEFKDNEWKNSYQIK